MTRGTNLIVDVDFHYIDPLNDIAPYLDEPWRTRVAGVDARRLLPSTLGDRMMQGRIFRADVDYNQAPGYTLPPEIGGPSQEQVLNCMSNLGIDAVILVSNRLSPIGHLSVRGLATALANGYIDYMLDRVVDPSKGIYTMPIIPWQEPEAGAAIIDRVAGNDAVVGVCFMTSGANPPLGDVKYDPIYAAAERHGLPIVYHGAPGLTLTEGANYADGFQQLLEAQSVGFVVSNMIQLTSILVSGLPERFPGLRYLFQEAGVFWVPMVMYRLDEYFLKRREEAPLLTALPSEYVRDRVYIGTQPIEVPKDSRHLEAVFAMCNGEKRFCFASDYPHFDYDDPSVIKKLPFLSSSAKAAVLHGNAATLFNFRKGGTQPWETTLSAEPRRSARASA
jgi:predicted TIM-barrel fold metal-dependent hydrolase